MTATSTATPTPSGPPLHKRLHWKAFIGPSIAALIAVLLLGGKVLDKLGGDVDPNQVLAAAQQGAAAGATPPTTTGTVPAPPPGYDYLTCTHAQPSDPIPCVPVLVWPLTDGAKNKIGFQAGGRATGQLNTANTRIILDQLRQMMGVDACSMWLGLEYDQAMNPLLTLYPSEVQAPQGSSKFVDCQPRAGTTQGTVPTEGGA